MKRSLKRKRKKEKDYKRIAEASLKSCEFSLNYGERSLRKL